MSNQSKEIILQRLQKTLHRDHHPIDAEKRKELLTPYAYPSPRTVTGDLLDTFIARARTSHMFVEITSLQDLPSVIAKKMNEENLENNICFGENILLSDLNWDEVNLNAIFGATTPEISVAGNIAFCGVAELGTLMFVSSVESPVSNNFLPDYFIAVLKKENIVAYFEDAWNKLHGEFSAMPRTVNWISGPSRTADIEATLVRGVHGPRQVWVFII